MESRPTVEESRQTLAIPEIPDVIAHRIQYANITRYVTPAPKGDGAPDLPNFADIQEAKDQGVVPGIHFQSAGELTFPQPWVPIQHYNPPGSANWWWDFDSWVVLRPGNPAVIGFGRLAPQVEIPDNGDNVTTLAVFNLDGGPINDTPALLVEPWLMGENTGPLPPDKYFSVKSGQYETDRANNQGLVDTVQAQEITALDAGFYKLVIWSYNNSFNPSMIFKAEPTNRVFKAEVGMVGRAKAWYKAQAGKGPGEPNNPVDWWKLGNPAVMRGSGGTLRERMSAAATIAGVAGKLAPELRREALDLAQRQASIAAAEIKREVKAPVKGTGTSGNGRPKNSRRVR